MGVPIIGKRDQSEHASLAHLNRILGASMIFYNFCVPVHDDGKTPAEKFGPNPPSWLRPIIEQYREKQLSFLERTKLVKDSMYLVNAMVPKIMRAVVEEKEDNNEDKRVRAVKIIMTELEDEKKLKEWRVANKNSRAYLESENKSVIVSSDNPYLSNSANVIVPYVATYVGRNMKRIRSALRSTESKQTVFDGQNFKIEITPYEVPDPKTEAFSVFAFPEKGPDVGTKIGLILLHESDLVLTSINEERYRTLKDITNSRVGRFIELLKEAKNLELVSRRDREFF